MAFNKSAEAANIEADAFVALLNGGSIVIYDGSQPANVATAITTQSVLVTLPIANPAASGSASNGVVPFNVASMIGTATGNGTATWARAFKSDGTTAVFDCTVGESGTDLLIDLATIAAGNEIKAVAPFNYTVPMAA